MQEAEERIRLKCVIFDLDGTLLDTGPGIMESVQHAAEELGFPELEEAQLRSFVGPPLRDSFRRCYGCGAEEAENLTTAYRRYYPKGAMLHADPYEGVFEVCQKLTDEGICLAVATSKPQQFAERVLQHFGFDKYMSIVHGADLEGKLQKADLIRMCVEDAKVRPEQCLMIGDSEFDAQGAQAASVPFLAVAYGFGDRNRMAAFPCEGVAETPMDILHYPRK